MEKQSEERKQKELDRERARTNRSGKQGRQCSMEIPGSIKWSF